MPDWTRVVRENLPGGRFRGEMAAEIQEEIAAHLEDTYVDALRMGATEEQAEAHARAQIEDSDRFRARYLKRFYQIQWDDPSLYHLVINTGKISLETSAEVVCSAVRNAPHHIASQESDLA